MATNDGFPSVASYTRCLGGFTYYAPVKHGEAQVIECSFGPRPSPGQNRKAANPERRKMSYFDLSAVVEGEDAFFSASLIVRGWLFQPLILDA